MQILLRLSDSEGPSNWLHRSRTLGVVIKAILDTQVLNNRLYLSLHSRVPPLYRSGVRYENEPNYSFEGQPLEEFALIPIVIARGWGDCDDLAPWRVSELQQICKESAKIRIQWKRQMLPGGIKGRKYFHIVVRRGDGSIEDPSALLGMHERQP